MSQEKYIGMDIHQATISVAVMDAGGKISDDPAGRQAPYARYLPRIKRL